MGSGSPPAASAAATTALCAVGQDTPKLSATSATDRQASPTAAAIARRSRPVVRARGGISAIASVNDFLEHAGSWQRHRRLCHTTARSPSP